ncbi:MAG: MtrB/PioB family outer membrane beta-barrel protein, partial [Woeseiaceae bacterium]|nr:MtrB/PioB family outer membrane beta-barrel protein [Woeseiaceae bacterium]
MTSRIALFLTTAALAAAAGAQTVDTSEWLCEFCPFEDGHSADYAVGASNVSDDSAWLGNATGYDEQGTYANLDGDGIYSSESYRLSWYAEDLGLDSRVLEIEGGKPGSYGYYLDWRELPYRQFITTSSVFSQNSDASLALPSGWVRAGTTAGFTALDSTLVGR